MSTNMKHERDLIQLFRGLIDSDQMFGIAQSINFGSDTGTKADVEYLSNNDEYLIIEAKSHKSRNAPNTRNQLFGQLLAEHGKSSPVRDLHRDKIALGILIPGDFLEGIEGVPQITGDSYYRDGFKRIPFEMFSAFGGLAQAKYVFVASKTKVEIYSWSGFYRSECPIHLVCA